MTLVSLSDCCRLLAIDPKTLHRWMSLSHLSAQPHPVLATWDIRSEKRHFQSDLVVPCCL